MNKSKKAPIPICLALFLCMVTSINFLIVTDVQAESTKIITWNGQCQFPSGSLEYRAFERASHLITKMSGGRLVLKPNPAGAIAPALRQFDAIDSGTIDYCIDPGVFWRDKWLAASLFDNKINGMRAVEQFLWFIKGGGVELAREMVKKYNIHITRSGMYYPPEIFLSTTQPLKSLADLKGLKIRTAGDDGTIFTQMGASVTMIPGGELYEAMKRGTIDAFQFMSPAGDVSIGLHEVVKYMYLSPVRQPCSFSMLSVNKKRWEELPDDLKAVVENAFLGEASRFYGEIIQQDAKAVEKYKERGVIVSQIPKDIEDQMAKLSDKMYKERGSKDSFYEKVLNSRHKFQQNIMETYDRL